MSINERLDIISPSSCMTCDTPIRRSDNTWKCCPGCGISQNSAENISNGWHRTRQAFDTARDRIIEA